MAGWKKKVLKKADGKEVARHLVILVADKSSPKKAKKKAYQKLDRQKPKYEIPTLSHLSSLKVQTQERQEEGIWEV